MDIGRRIAEIREEAGFTQSSLARAVGTSQSAISQIEKGGRNPSYDMLRQIAEALGVTTPYLVGGQIVGLQPDEEALYRQYRAFNTAAKRELQDFAEYLRHKHAELETGRSRRSGSGKPGKGR